MPAPKNRLRQRGLFASGLAFMSGTAIMMLVVMITVDVVLRRFGRSIAPAYEASEVLLVVVVFLGLAYAQFTGAHIAVDIVTSRLPKRIAIILIAGAYAVAILVVGWIAFETLERAIDSVGQREYRFGLTRVPIWHARVAVPVGLSALLIELVRSLSNTLRDKGDQRER